MTDKKPAGQTRSGATSPYAAFRVPAFTWWMIGMFLVQIGGTAKSTAVAWEIYLRTGSALSLAAVGLIQAVPMLVLTLPAGYLADILDRRKLIIAGTFGTVLTSLGLAACSLWDGSTQMMYGLIFLNATFLRLVAPARMSLLPTLVPAHLLENAVKWRTSMTQIAHVVGPAMGGIILSYSLPITYLFSALCGAVYIVLMGIIHIPATVRAVPGRMAVKIMEGIRFVWQHPLILGTLSLDLFAVLLGGVTFLLPIFVRDIINLEGTGLTEEQALGWLRAAPAFGALMMAIILAHSGPFRKAGAAMLWSVAAFGVATLVFALSANLWLSFAMLFLTGAFDNISVVVRHTLIQLFTPNEMRGRVAAVSSLFIGSSNDIGGARAGLVAAMAGPVASALLGGAGTILIVGLWAKWFPDLRRFGALADASPGNKPVKKPAAS